MTQARSSSLDASADPINRSPLKKFAAHPTTAKQRGQSEPQHPA